jgi:CHAD domain-containing protein
MATETEEREVKLDVGLQFALPDLTGVAYGVTEAELPRAELVATYYDTPDQRLLNHGITLRHRRDRVNPGSENQWTLKLPSDTGGGLTLGRTEYSWPGDVETIPYEALHLVRAIIRHAQPIAVAELITNRRRLMVKGPGGIPLAEVDDDTVAVMDGLRLAERFRQVEVELQVEGEEVLDSVVARLVAAGAVVGVARPKLAQALGLPALPTGASSSSLAATALPKNRRKMTLGNVVRNSIASGVDRLVRHDLIVRLDSDPEGVHQARVATRRLRSDLRTFRDALDPEWTAQTRGELKWLASALGEVRDADVLAERLKAQASSHLGDEDREGFDALLNRLNVERQNARKQLLEMLDSERYLDLLDELSAAAVAPPFRQGFDQSVRVDRATIPLVRRPWKKLRKAVENLDPYPDNQALHQVRIKAKRARYAAEAAAVAVGKRARRFAKALAGLQDVLGDHQDAVSAEAWLRSAAFASAGLESAGLASASLESAGLESAGLESAGLESASAAPSVPAAPAGGVFVAGELAEVQRYEQSTLRERWRSVWESVNTKKLTAWLS